jgi:hypothetical protein
MSSLSDLALATTPVCFRAPRETTETRCARFRRVIIPLGLPPGPLFVTCYSLFLLFFDLSLTHKKSKSCRPKSRNNTKFRKSQKGLCPRLYITKGYANCAGQDVQVSQNATDGAFILRPLTYLILCKLSPSQPIRPQGLPN